MARTALTLVSVVLFLAFCLAQGAVAPGDNSVPLVSVIIPTYGRPEFLKKAIELVRRQDYPNIEVVIVDDSPQPQADLPKDNNIKYIHLKSRVSIGEKRNVAVQNAKGQVVVHWDDDDYFREHRVSEQVAPILRGEVDMTVLEHHYYFHLPTQAFYTVKRASSWGPHFATFVYKKSLFDKGLRYPETSMAEDYAFAEFALKQGASIRVMSNEDGKHVYVRHQNTWEFDFNDYDAQIQEVERPSFFYKEDFDFYVTLKSGPVSKPSAHYASDLIKWDRPELHPTLKSGNAPPYYPHYPKYPKYPHYKHKDDSGLSTAAKIGIGVGVAGGVALIIAIGIAGYFFLQWSKNHGAYERINEGV